MGRVGKERNRMIDVIGERWDVVVPVEIKG